MARTEQLVEHRFAARANELPDVRTKVRSTAGGYGFSPETVNAMVLAVDEACANIIRHGYGDDDAGDILLEILSHENTIIFRLTDYAEPVDKDRIRPRDLDDIRPGGLGVHFMQEVMDEVEYVDPPEGIGNILELRKSIARS